MNPRLTEYTWPQVEELLESDPVVVVPVGANEQHGRHLPLKVDWGLVSDIAERSACRASDEGVPCLVTPPVWTGYSPHHMQFPGTITLDASTFARLLIGVATSLRKHGFRYIMFLNGHGGNINLVRSVVQQLRFEYQVETAGASYWDLALEEIRRWRMSPLGGIGHACELETSLMLALYPHLVETSEVEDFVPTTSHYSASDLTSPGPVTTSKAFHERTPHGVIGSPTFASGDRGQLLLDEIADAVARFLIAFKNGQ